jgi:DNA-binding transcriptional regulator GbsR (MarR family)
MRFFKRWQEKRKARELQLRIDHCRRTMAEVENALGSEELQPELSEQFHRLGEALAEVDVSQVGERDLEKIETVTNKLLSEFRGLYLQGKLKNIHDGRLH